MSVSVRNNLAQYIRGGGAVEISDGIESAIRAGDLSKDSRLPAIRALASALGVSPATVSAAYRRLQSRGLLVARGRLGTRVSPRVPRVAKSILRPPPGTRDLGNGSPDPLLLPDLRAALGSLRPKPRLYNEALMHPEFRKLASRDFEADEIPAQSLAVVSGALDGIERVLATYLRPGDRVAVEDPAFSGVLDLLNALNLIPVPVEVDASGLKPDALAEAVRTKVDALILTPRAQNPTGATLDVDRMHELRQVLRKAPELLVLEDDHAGPVAGSPAYSIACAQRRWAVVRSVSKALGPDLRLAVLAGDAATLSRIEDRQFLGMRWVSHLLQELVVSLWKEKGMKRHLRQVAATYRERRGFLLEALASHEIEVDARSGLNVWIEVEDETSVMSGLLCRKWAVAPGSRFRIASAPAIRVTTAAMTAKIAAEFASDLSETVQSRQLIHAV